VSEKKEYIERGALIKAFECENAVKYGNKNAEQQHKSYSSMMLYEIADEIYDAPAADVEPVVRGELRINEQGFLECSACGEALRMPLVSIGEMKRCYVCGAHMERSGSGE